MSILDFFAGVPRPVQREVLTLLGAQWDAYDVFVLQLPVATGKTKIAECIAAWTGNAAIITPNNMLVRQYTESCADMPTIHKRASYTCQRGEHLNCETNRRRRESCYNCRYTQKLQEFGEAPFYVANYYTYLAHKNWRETLIVDEAHNLLKMLVDDVSYKIWHHKYKYPRLRTLMDLLMWIDDREAPPDKLLQKVRDTLVTHGDRTLVENVVLPYHGKPRECLRVKPIDYRGQPPILWNPRRVRKIVLMSATITEHDIYDLGLDTHRVCYLNAGSSIPTAQRLCHVLPGIHLSHATIEKKIGELTDSIKQIAAQHPTEKGIVHAPYRIARMLRERLRGDSRFVFHAQHDKHEVYREFRDTNAAVVLVASGMYEGIDLPYDAGRWQVISKVPYLSLGDSAVRHKMEKSPGWYAWQAARLVIQAYGRICRTPDDTGVTYVLDSNFKRLYTGNQELFPAWFQEAVNVL